MSKHTGNFLTLEETVEKYGADAPIIAFANTGDGIEDANFEEMVLLRLYTLKGWCGDIVRNAEAGKLRQGPKEAFWDRVFENEMKQLIGQTREHYERTSYKLALKTGF
ncbi:hypothetical protein HOY80DRAFT_1064727 [Tuber brumale]|nr:hypothetical protein HOY80DRAFT_1064727 [Tuber brumale]